MATKLTEQEIELLKDLKQKNETKMFEFGQIEIEIILAERLIESLYEKKTNLQQEFIAMQDSEQETAKTLNEKYGDGSIDLDKGEFIPS